MKTLDASLWQDQRIRPAVSKKDTPFMTAPLRSIMELAYALLAAAMTVTLSVWAAGLDINAMLGVGTWGLGFIFLGLAVDNQGTIARLQTVTGIVLAVLALLQNNVSPGFTIVSGVLMAAWFAALILKQLRHQNA